MKLRDDFFCNWWMDQIFPLVFDSKVAHININIQKFRTCGKIAFIWTSDLKYGVFDEVCQNMVILGFEVKSTWESSGLQNTV